MKREMILAAMIGLTGALGIGSHGVVVGDEPPKETVPDTKERPDEKFAVAAARGNLAKIALGKLALSNGNNEDVRKFAQKMIDEHTQANDDLEQAVLRKDIILPKEPDDKSKEILEQLRKIQGAAFDRQYIAYMVSDHKEDEKLFDDAVENVKSTELRAYAQKMLPIIRRHEKAAAEIERALNKTASD